MAKLHDDLKEKASRYRIPYRIRGNEKSIEELQADIDEYEEVLRQIVKLEIRARHPNGQYKSLNDLRGKLEDYEITRKLAQEYGIPTELPNGSRVSLYKLQGDIHRYELNFNEEEFMPTGCSQYEFFGPDSNKKVAIYILDQTALNLLVVHEKVIPVNQRKIGVPKGKVKIGESFTNAFYRETCEEIGIDLNEIPHEVLKETNKKIVIMLREDWDDVPVFRGREIAKIEWLQLSWLINDIKENPDVYNYSIRSEIAMFKQIYHIVTSNKTFQKNFA